MNNNYIFIIKSRSLTLRIKRSMESTSRKRKERKDVSDFKIDNCLPHPTPPITSQLPATVRRAGPNVRMGEVVQLLTALHIAWAGQ